MKDWKIAYFTETPISSFRTCVFSNPITSVVKLFTTKVHGCKPLTNATKNSILNAVRLYYITFPNFFPGKLSLAASEIIKVTFHCLQSSCV